MKVWKLKKKKNNKINKYLSVFNRLMCFSKLHQNRLSPMISNTSDSPYDGCKTGNAPMSLELGYYLSVACSWDPMKQFESPSVPSEFWTCPKVRSDLMRPFSRINKCDASCNGSDRTYEMLNLQSQTVLKRSGANCGY